MAVLRRPRGWKPKYGLCPLTPREGFTLKVYFGGEIVIRSGQLKYAGGKYRYFDWVTLKEMNISTLYQFSRELGLEDPASLDYYYNDDSVQRYSKLTAIMNTRDVIKMCTNLDVDRVAIVYVYQVQRTTPVAATPSDYVGGSNIQATTTVINISDYELDSGGETDGDTSEISLSLLPQGSERMQIFGEKNGSALQRNFGNKSRYSSTKQNRMSKKGEMIKFMEGNTSLRKYSIMETGHRDCPRDHRRAENVNGTGKTKSGRRAKVMKCSICQP